MWLDKIQKQNHDITTTVPDAMRQATVEAAALERSQKSDLTLATKVTR